MFMSLRACCDMILMFYNTHSDLKYKQKKFIYICSTFETNKLEFLLVFKSMGKYVLINV